MMNARRVMHMKIKVKGFTAQAQQFYHSQGLGALSSHHASLDLQAQISSMSSLADRELYWE